MYPPGTFEFTATPPAVFGKTDSGPNVLDWLTDTAFQSLTELTVWWQRKGKLIECSAVEMVHPLGTTSGNLIDRPSDITFLCLWPALARMKHHGKVVCGFGAPSLLGLTVTVTVGWKVWDVKWLVCTYLCLQRCSFLHTIGHVSILAISSLWPVSPAQIVWLSQTKQILQSPWKQEIASLIRRLLFTLHSFPFAVQVMIFEGVICLLNWSVAVIAASCITEHEGWV